MRYSFAKEYENRKVIAEETVKCIRQGYYFVDDVIILDKNFSKIGDIVKGTNKITPHDTIYVKIIDIDEKMNHLSLSIKDINYKDTSFQRKRKINETSLGFTTLKSNLPDWIKESLKK